MDRDSQQVKTRKVTWSSIVGAAAFKAGIEDYSNGVARFDEFSKTEGGRSRSWHYERGRLFAASQTAAGQAIPPTRAGRAVNAGACVALAKAFRQGDVL